MTWGPFNILYPGADNLRQWIDTRWWSPTITVNYAGNPAVEREVTEDVASFGKQIGWLNDIVAVLATDENAKAMIGRNTKAADALKKFIEAQAKIDAIKTRRKEDALATAREALAKLGATDKETYRYLVSTLDPNEPPSA